MKTTRKKRLQYIATSIVTALALLITFFFVEYLLLTLAKDRFSEHTMRVNACLIFALVGSSLMDFSIKFLFDFQVEKKLPDFKGFLIRSVAMSPGIVGVCLPIAMHSLELNRTLFATAYVLAIISQIAYTAAIKHTNGE